MSAALRCLTCGVVFAFGDHEDRVDRFMQHSCTGTAVELTRAARRHPASRPMPITDGAA